jgi:putative transposase
MARPPRLVVPDIALHIVQRGNDRQVCFREDTDYLVYLSNLRDLARKMKCALHAYCLMTNHVHLLMTPAEPSGCVMLMRDLGQRYVGYFNRRYARTGTLWEGRFRSHLVDSAAYVLACYRYIELNPVRARMVGSPGAYTWSSHNGNSGAVQNVLLTPHAEYAALAADDTARWAAYRRLFDATDDPVFLEAVREAARGGYPLIGENLKSRLEASGLPRLERGRPGPKPEAGVERDPISLELGL